MTSRPPTRPTPRGTTGSGWCAHPRPAAGVLALATAAALGVAHCEGARAPTYRRRHEGALRPLAVVETAAQCGGWYEGGECVMHQCVNRGCGGTSCDCQRGGSAGDGVDASCSRSRCDAGSGSGAGIGGTGDDPALAHEGDARNPGGRRVSGAPWVPPPALVHNAL
eukprot:scaffold1441_cov120-Isochrysis_galbana.AAC.6